VQVLKYWSMQDLVPTQWSQEAWGMLSYAASAFCSAMMVMTVKLGVNSGMSTWELLMARSLFLLSVSLWEITVRKSGHSGNGMVVGTRDIACLHK
jgi:cytosine/uracil/thiamine/allantoin permease